MPGSGVMRMWPGLGLPPRVHHRATAAADHLPVPHPRLRVDRLADRPEETQARQVAPLRILVAPAHEGADRGGRRVADRDAVLLDDPPEPVLVREVRRALVHHAGRAVGQRAVDDVGVPGHPSDVGGAPVHVGVLQVEDPLGGRVDARSGSRRSCGRCPWACRWSPTCTAGRACPRRPSFRADSRRARRGRSRPTRRRGRPPCRRRAWCASRTMTVLTSGHSLSASSTFFLSGTMLPRRKPPSAVMRTVDSASWMRSRTASGAKPPKITLWGAPIRLQASIAMGSSGTIGM